MRCQQIEELLDHYLAGQLEPDLARKVEQHLDDCAACQSLFLPADPELDVLLGSDWFLTEPSENLTARMLERVSPPLFSWKRLGVITFIWSAYLTVWLVIALQLWRPALFTGLIVGVSQLARMIAPLWTAVQVVWRTLRLVQVNPAVCVLLLMLSGLALFGLRRLEKEGLA